MTMFIISIYYFYKQYISNFFQVSYDIIVKEKRHIFSYQLYILNPLILLHRIVQGARIVETG